ncbi:uncharacterized protein IUM83_16555 [Phytophthora cinnamomi]|uniref:uncharacterized protein n=1 Tax=Phytophthora cinnamomi TaxID=4785 RepID=UPI0035593C64|nr:hypothetical protein IUM83_16555 [Phytophthora cinnamomi]
MRRGLLQWLQVLQSPNLNGVSPIYFYSQPPPDNVVEMDAPDEDLCALVRSEKLSIVHSFSIVERELICQTKECSSVGFDINYRVLLSVALAAYT